MAHSENRRFLGGAFTHIGASNLKFLLTQSTTVQRLSICQVSAPSAQLYFSSSNMGKGRPGQRLVLKSAMCVHLQMSRRCYNVKQKQGAQKINNPRVGPVRPIGICSLLKSDNMLILCNYLNYIIILTHLY